MNDINYYEKNYSYPLPSDPDFLTKIYKKREFYYHRVPKRDKMKNYKQVKQYREMTCKIEKKPTEQQYILPNFINLNTPYKGVLLMHGVGTGKTMTAIRIAEQFIDQIRKYNTKIYVVVPGPNTRENFKKELIFSTGNTYLKNTELINQMSKKKLKKKKKLLYMRHFKIIEYFHIKLSIKKYSVKKLLKKKLLIIIKLNPLIVKILMANLKEKLLLIKFLIWITLLLLLMKHIILLIMNMVMH